MSRQFGDGPIGAFIVITGFVAVWLLWIVACLLGVVLLGEVVIWLVKFIFT